MAVKRVKMLRDYEWRNGVAAYVRFKGGKTYGVTERQCEDMMGAGACELVAAPKPKPDTKAAKA